MEAASALAILLHGIGESVRVFTFSDYLVEVSGSGSGFSLVKTIKNSQPNSGTRLTHSLKQLYNNVTDMDRLIVITDEQVEDDD